VNQYSFIGVRHSCKSGKAAPLIRKVKECFLGISVGTCQDPIPAILIEKSHFIRDQSKAWLFGVHS